RYVHNVLRDIIANSIFQNNNSTIISNILLCHIFSLMTGRPPISTLFPYTTLFRSYGPRYHSCHMSFLPKPSRLSVYFIEVGRSEIEEHTSELQSRFDLVCRLLLEKKKKIT